MSKEGRQETIVTVQRAALVRAMTRVGATTSRMGAAGALMVVANCELTITRAGCSETIPVEGHARFEAYVKGSWLRRAKRLVPQDDPLEIGFDGEFIRFATHRYPAAVSSPKQYSSPTDDGERNRRLERAAEVLQPYGVTVDDLAELCHMESKINDVQKLQPLTDRIARAWAQLSAFGIDTEDLEYLVSQKLRTAWKR